MEWIYNANRRMIRKLKEDSEIDLTEIESKFIEVISNNKLISWEEIADYLYGDRECSSYYEQDIYRSSITTKSRVLKKVKLNIETMRGKGIQLLDQIYIE